MLARVSALSLWALPRHLLSTVVLGRLYVADKYDNNGMIRNFAPDPRHNIITKARRLLTQMEMELMEPTPNKDFLTIYAGTIIVDLGKGFVHGE
jgi:hypothetical protein